MTVYRGNPVVRIRPLMTLEKDGVRVSELRLGSHTGTHVDAPSHFIKGGKGIDRMDPERFIGPAWVADLRRVKGGIGALDLAKARIPLATRRVLLRPRKSRRGPPAIASNQGPRPNAPLATVDVPSLLRFRRSNSGFRLPPARNRRLPRE